MTSPSWPTKMTPQQMTRLFQYEAFIQSGYKEESVIEGDADLVLPPEMLPSDLFGFIFFLQTCLCLNVARDSGSSSFFLCLNTFLVPGPVRASTTCAQSLVVFGGKFFHLLTISTHALHISPFLASSNLKQVEKFSSYFPLSVKRELNNEK